MSNEVIMPFLVECFMQTTIVALILGAAAAAFRNRPHVAYVFLAIIVMKCLCPPVIKSPWAVFRAAEVAPVAPRTVSRQPGVSLRTTTYKWPDSSAFASTPIRLLAPRDMGSPRWQVPWFALIATVWFSGFAFFIMRSWRGLRSAKRAWLRSEIPTPKHVLDLADTLRFRLGIRRPVRVIVNSAQFGPLVSGGWRPVVVLPSALVESADQRELQSSIAHELVHVRRGDTTLCFFQTVATALWWFHPLVWWASRELDRVCERCCDQETIAGLGCRPRHYVFSLLRVAELRQHIRHVPGLSGSRPLHITAHRLRELMGRNRFAARPPLYCQIALVVLATTLLPIMTQSQPSEAYAAQATESGRKSQTPNLDRPFFEEEWQQAADQYESYLRKNPHDALRRFRLGYSYHFLGQYDRARESYQQVVDLPEMRPQSLYNLACIHSLQGRNAMAKEVLAQSLAAGMVLRRPVLDDPDFKSMLDDPEFKTLAVRFPVIDRRDVLSQLDLWIGEWELLNEDRQVLGVSSVTKETGGYMITEKWQPVGRVGGTSVTYFDASDQKWKQTFVSGQGPITRYEGTFEEGQLSLIGDTVFPNGAKTTSRAQMTFVSRNEVRFLMESSRDNGASWYPKFSGTYRRLSQASRS